MHMRAVKCVLNCFTNCSDTESDFMFIGMILTQLLRARAHTHARSHNARGRLRAYTRTLISKFSACKMCTKGSKKQVNVKACVSRPLQHDNRIKI
jgi:hypothetical protein